MKRVLINLLTVGSIALLMFASCKKSDLLVKSDGGTAGKLSASSTTLVLDSGKQNDDSTKVVTFTFTAPQYNFRAAVTNTIQIDSVGDNWQKPQLITLTTNQLSYGFTTPDLNNLLLNILPYGVSSPVNVRIQHEVSSTQIIYSNVVTLNVTPYTLARYIYAAGAYEGWSVPSSSLASLVSPTGNGIYTGYVNFPQGSGNQDFKILPENKDFNGNYGAGTAAGTITQGTGNPPNLTAPQAAYFQLTVNLNTNTIVYGPQWSVIGDATPGGWNTDTDLNYDATSGTYYTTVLLVSDGTQAIKFRFQNDWTVNLGGAAGALTSGGANITIPATAAGGDTYKITLNVKANTYTLVKQ